MNAVATTIAIDEQGSLEPVDTYGLTAKQETFCRWYVDTHNAMQAYRQAYDVGATTLAKTVWEAASRLRHDSKIAARIKHLEDIAAAETITNCRELMQHCYDIATADPSELVRYERKNCRHCRGVDYGYQWIDWEWADAAAKAIDLDLPTPDDTGGFGFNPTLDPVQECPHCFGEGVERAYVADITKVVGKARKLYAGLKVTQHGIEVKMHDQTKHRELIGRMLGAFKDTLPGQPNPASPVQATRVVADLTPANSARTYMQMIGKQTA